MFVGGWWPFAYCGQIEDDCQPGRQAHFFLHSEKRRIVAECSVTEYKHQSLCTTLQLFFGQTADNDWVLSTTGDHTRCLLPQLFILANWPPLTELPISGPSAQLSTFSGCYYGCYTNAHETWMLKYWNRISRIFPLKRVRLRAMVTKAGWDRKGRSGFGDISVLGDKHIWPWWPDTRETFSGHFCLKSKLLSWQTGETIQHFSECEKVMEIPVVMFSLHKLAISNKGLVSRQHHHDWWHCLGGLSLWQTTSHWWFPSSQTTSCSDHSSNEKQLFFH